MQIVDLFHPLVPHFVFHKLLEFKVCAVQVDLFLAKFRFFGRGGLTAIAKTLEWRMRRGVVVVVRLTLLKSNVEGL
jgi:hypothetical protein